MLSIAAGARGETEAVRGFRKKLGLSARDLNAIGSALPRCDRQRHNPADNPAMRGFGE